jgi:hypothetical protein
VVAQLAQPALHVLVGQVLGDVVHQEGTDGPAVVPGGRCCGNNFLPFSPILDEKIGAYLNDPILAKTSSSLS